MFPLVALSFFFLLSSASVLAYPLYYARRQPPATAYLQPYHPGLAIPPSAKPPYALSRRFIKDADYASGSSLPAFSDKSPHKRQLPPPDLGSTAVQFDNRKLPTT